MSSLPDSSRTAPVKSSCLPWEPVVFSSKQEEKSIDPEKIIRLFQPEIMAPTSISRRVNGSALVKANSVFVDFQPWAPSTISELKPQVEEVDAPPAFLGDAPVEQPVHPMKYADTQAIAAEEVEQILEDARLKAEEIIQSAENTREEIIQRAIQEGREEGHREVKTLVETSQNIILQLQDWKDEMEQASESTILDMVKEIARTLFGHGFSLEQEALQQAFHHVLENARSLGDLRIYVNPEDARNLDAYWREFQTNFTGHQVQILSTDAITRGGCFVQGEMGSVDARIETQMAAIMDTLNASMHSEGQEQDAGPGA